MDGKLGFGRPWRWARARPDADVALDAADVGTAFGMELCIEAEQRASGDTASDADPSEAMPTAARAGR